MSLIYEMITPTYLIESSKNCSDDARQTAAVLCSTVNEEWWHVGGMETICGLLNMLEQTERRALNAESKLNEMNEWQPIETAPMDGRFVLTYRNADPYIEPMYYSGTYWNWFDGDSPTLQPTHWMPLPESPK